MLTQHPKPASIRTSSCRTRSGCRLLGSLNASPTWGTAEPAATGRTELLSGRRDRFEGGRLKFQLARDELEFNDVAHLWAEALLLPGLTELPPPSDAKELRTLAEEVAERLKQSHNRKLQAAADTRVLRRRGQALMLMLRAGGLTVLEYQTARRQLDDVRRELARARRRRMWACLAAYHYPDDVPSHRQQLQQEQEQVTSNFSVEGAAELFSPRGDELEGTRAEPIVASNLNRRCSLAGYLLVSVTQPLAVLPPPLPSRAPYQVHVDALAVAPGCRRRGVGSRLLDEAERLALRWGATSLWLRVEACNEAAVELYSDRGYGIARVENGHLGQLGLSLAGGLDVRSLMRHLPFARRSNSGSNGGRTSSEGRSLDGGGGDANEADASSAGGNCGDGSTGESKRGRWQALRAHGLAPLQGGAARSNRPHVSEVSESGAHGAQRRRHQAEEHGSHQRAELRDPDAAPRPPPPPRPPPLPQQQHAHRHTVDDSAAQRVSLDELQGQSAVREQRWRRVRRGKKFVMQKRLQKLRPPAEKGPAQGSARDSLPAWSLDTFHPGNRQGTGQLGRSRIETLRPERKGLEQKEQAGLEVQECEERPGPRALSVGASQTPSQQAPAPARAGAPKADRDLAPNLAASPFDVSMSGRSSCHHKDLQPQITVPSHYTKGGPAAPIGPAGVGPDAESSSASGYPDDNDGGSAQPRVYDWRVSRSG